MIFKNMQNALQEVSFLLKDGGMSRMKVYGHDLYNLQIRYKEELIVLKNLLEDVKARIGNTAFPALTKRIQDFLEKIA